MDLNDLVNIMLSSGVWSSPELVSWASHGQIPTWMDWDHPATSAVCERFDHCTYVYNIIYIYIHKIIIYIYVYITNNYIYRKSQTARYWQYDEPIAVFTHSPRTGSKCDMPYLLVSLVQRAKLRKKWCKSDPWYGYTEITNNWDGFVTEMWTEKKTLHRCNLKGKMMMIDHEAELGIPFWTIRGWNMNLPTKYIYIYTCYNCYNCCNVWTYDPSLDAHP